MERLLSWRCRLAQRISGLYPSMEMLRFVSTGTEATMAALRVARGATGRDKIIKIEGGFHGAHDSVLVKAGSGATTLGIPDSRGVPADTAKNTLQVPYNDLEALEKVLEELSERDRLPDHGARSGEHRSGSAGGGLPGGRAATHQKSTMFFSSSTRS